MSIALGFFVITYFLKFYGEAAVAAFGVGTRIEQIALLPAIGLSCCHRLHRWPEQRRG